MDKEFFLNAGIPQPQQFEQAPIPLWQPISSSAPEIQPHTQLHSWRKSMDQFTHFDPSLSSMASSAAAAAAAAGSSGGDASVIRELIGKMGTICSSGEVTPPQSQPLFVTAAAAAAASTLGMAQNRLNCSDASSWSPAPKLMNFPPMVDQIVKERLPSSGNSIPGNPAVMDFSGDPGFAERAAKFSCFGSRSFDCRKSQLGLNKHEPSERSNNNNPLIHRVSGSPLLKTAGSQMGLQGNGKIFPLQDGGEIETEMECGSSDRKLSRLSNGSSPRSHAEFGNSQEESSVSEQIPSGETSALKASSNDLNPRKRKAVASRANKAKDLPSTTPSSAKAPHKIAEDNNSSTKRSKLAEGNEDENDDRRKGADETKASSPKPPEPPKDYIHVRARRGQATDSHSLAERVRREKISERMKLLQDLVPGCNKVTGKALMLDEIINYVQSLQRQVEFLSMKLASVDFSNTESASRKDNMFQTSSALPHRIYHHSLDSSPTALFGQQPQQSPPLPSNSIPSGAVTQCSVDQLLDKALCGNHNLELPQLNGFVDETVPELPPICQDDLHSIVQMGYLHNQNQDTAFQMQKFHGSVQ